MTGADMHAFQHSDASTLGRIDPASRPLLGASCLVLGAGGFIGTNLAHALVDAGARVHGYGRPPVYAGSVPAKARWTTGDFTDGGALRLAVSGADIVYHLLGGSIPATSNRDPAGEMEAASLSVRLLDLCRDAGVRKVIFVSSGGTVYGIPRSVPIAEDAATDPISAYGIGKLAVEKYLALYAHLHGLRSVVLRAANPYGPYQSPARGQGVVSAMIASALAGRPLEVWGDGHVVRDFLYVGDLARALILAATYDGPHRVFNVGSGIGRSLLEVARSVDTLMGETRPVVHKPGRPADVPVNVLDIGRIGREMGWAPETGWMDGLRTTARWMRTLPGPF